MGRRHVLAGEKGHFSLVFGFYLIAIRILKQLTVEKSKKLIKKLKNLFLCYRFTR